MKMTTGGKPRKQMTKDELINELRTLCSIVEQDNVKLREQVKNLTIPVVSQQRELLLAFAKHRNIYTDEMQGLNEIDVDEFLKANNCG